MIVSQWPDISHSDIKAVTDQLRSGELSSAGKIRVINELENKFCSMTKCKYSVAVSSGTMALYSALFAIGIEPGDEVIIPVYTYHAVGAPLVAMNAVPVFADIDEVYGHVSATTIEESISSKTKAIIVVHSYGYATDMFPIIEMARKYDLRVIEDCSHAHGCSYKESPVGGIGDIGFFSLQASKLVPAGEGGILVTSNKLFYDKVLLLGQHYDRTSLEVTDPYLQLFVKTGLGLKLRINPLGAALANNQFDRLFNYINKRKETYMYIAEGISNLQRIRPIIPQSYMSVSTFYSYRFKFKSLNDDFFYFISQLSKKDSNISMSSGKPLIDESLFKHSEYDFGFIKRKPNIESSIDEDYPGFERYRNSIFRVPLYYNSKYEIDTMIDTIQSTYFDIFNE